MRNLVILIVVCVVGIIGYLEKIWANRCLRHLRYGSSYDKMVVEPNEVVTQTSYLQNNWRFPVLYARLLEALPQGVKIEESEDFIRKNTSRAVTETVTNFGMYVMPHSRCSVKMRFSYNKRGEYKKTEYKVEAGDFLGFSSKILAGKCDQSVVVMPYPTSDPVALKMLGGFMGDLSAKRFIHEDPVLTVGYREYSGREPMKSISWTQTARTGQLQVKQYDHTMDCNVVLVLNVDRGSREEIEACFEIIRTVCEELEKKHTPYEFFTNGDIYGPLGNLSWLEEGLGYQHFSMLMYGLGQSECKSLDSLENLLNRVYKRKRSEKNYILITVPLSEKDHRTVERLKRLCEQDVCVLESNGEMWTQGGEA